MKTSPLASLFLLCLATSAKTLNRRGTVPDGQPCPGGDSDCLTNSVCVIPDAGPSECGPTGLAVDQTCVQDKQCTTGYCSRFSGSISGAIYKCRPENDRPKLDDNADCSKNTECKSGLCSDPGTGFKTCQTRDVQNPGEYPCTTAADCPSGGTEECFPNPASPSNKICLFIGLPLGFKCLLNEQCASGNCSTSLKTCGMPVDTTPGTPNTNSTPGVGTPTPGPNTPGSNTPTIVVKPVTITTTAPNGSILTLTSTPTPTVTVTRSAAREVVAQGVVGSILVCLPVLAVLAGATVVL